MKNLGTGLLAFLAFSLCCGGPVIIGSLFLASLGWFTGDVVVLSLAVIVGVVGIVAWKRKRRAKQCGCGEQSEIHTIKEHKHVKRFSIR